MRHALVKVWCATQFTIEVYETEEGVSNIPVLLYRFVVQKNELRCMPGMLHDIGVIFVDVEHLNARYFYSEYVFARLIFTVPKKELAYVQTRFS